MSRAIRASEGVETKALRFSDLPRILLKAGGVLLALSTPPWAAVQSPAPAASPSAADFAPLDIPGWVILADGASSKQLPWILVVDDPQCPYCMQLHLGLEKARESADPEISRAVIARLPFPLAYHDQSAHIVMDAFCLEAGRASGRWSAASYLDWLIANPWKAEPGWSGATIEELAKDGGLFDAKYDSHRVTSSRRRDFQTETARAEAACLPGGCREDADCEKLCVTETECRSACPPAVAAAAAPPPAPAGTAGGGTPADAPKQREQCLAECVNRFVSARYRQYSKTHSACLLEDGPQSAHGKTAAAFAWAIAHKVPGTPTVYAGHPSIGFRMLGDSDNLSDFIALLRRTLADARARMKTDSLTPR